MSRNRIRSVIPGAAKEVKRKEPGIRGSDYFIRGKLIGRRYWEPTGELTDEWSFKDGICHGIWRSWHPNGQLRWQTRYKNGLEHGTSRQWNKKGELIGTYSMRMGTGVDLWWALSDKFPSEERHMVKGERHGFERWWNRRNEVWRESHFQHGKEHGVFRVWKSGKLRRGYPLFFTNGRKVTKREYLKAAGIDATLPPYQKKEDSPRRMPLSFPLDGARRLVR